MKSQRKLNNNRWAFEQLENRNLLAGNVAADASTGALIITGDNAANVLVITQVAANSYKVTPGGTKLNGSFSAQTFSNVTDGVFIDMGGGNDSLTLKGLTINGGSGEISLGILLGDGSDALVISSVTTEEAGAINGGSGNNAIVIDKSSFGYDLGIQTNDGVDAITITRSTVFGALSIQMGNGTNALSMVSDNVNEIEEHGTPSSDLPEGFGILDEAFFEIDCGAEIEGGSGVDAISMVKVNIDCETEINTFGGNDAVAITNSTFGNAPVIDEVTPATPTKIIGEDSGLCIETGTGNDAVAINATVVYGFLQIDTTGGYDCPTDEICDIASGTQLDGTEQTGKDGNDAVTLNNVQVLQSQHGLCLTEWCDCIESSPNFETNGISDSTWFQCCCELGTVESGMLIIYTGNQTDAVALNKVTTDAEASIYTTDESNLDGADSVVITNSSFNQNNEVMEFPALPLIVPNTGLEVETGNGNDAVTIVKVKVVGEAAIETDGGTDAVAINSLTADFIFADLGSGNYDTLTVAKSVSNSEEFEGGGDTGDTLVYKHLANNFANPPLISGFANVL
jgi:large repetitive protein